MERRNRFSAHTGKKATIAPALTLYNLSFLGVLLRCAVTMPPRLRSKPYGPNSPNAAEGLPDPVPRRRRATRSASAQPQEDQAAPPAREPKTRKTRGKAASRGKKKATARTSPSCSPPPSAAPQPDQLEGDDTASSAAPHTPSEKVESPIIELGAVLEQEEAQGPTVDEPAVDHLQDVLPDFAPSETVLLEGRKADLSAAQQIQAELKMHIPQSPSVEIPGTVLPSIESSDHEVTTPIPGGCESPNPFFSLPSSVSLFSVRSSSVVSASSTPSDTAIWTNSPPSEALGNQRRSWLMTQLGSLYRLCTRTQGASVPSAATTAPAVGWSQQIPVFNPHTAQSYSALDDLELISLIRAVRSGRESNRRRPRASPSISASEQSRVLRAQGATPIHRSRTSYVNRSNSRRIESRGSLGRTLYRLPQLLSFHSEPELQDGSSEATNPIQEQDSPDSPPETIPPKTPKTPERSTPAAPVAPMTAPPAGTDVSPGWSRWIFNGVSRRWTVLRGRFTHDHGHETANENQPAVAAASEPVVSATPVTAAQPGLVAPMETSPTIVSRPLAPPTATSKHIKRPAFSPVDEDKEMSPRVQDLSPPPLRPVLPLPHPRRRTMSFVDTRTILAAGDPTFDPGDETQHEFVKRRQAARAAALRKKAEERRRAEAEEREILAAERAAAQEAVHSKLSASSHTPKETSASVSGSPSASNTVDRGSSVLSRLFPMASNSQIAPASHESASVEAPVQPAAKSNVDAEKSHSRKRSRGFGLDEDDLAVHEEDFTPEEWEVLKAQVEKAEEEAAKAAQESAPPTKKRRVDQSPKQQKRTQRIRRQTTTPRQSQPPSRTAGFIPNRRGTFAPPDLSPIDSSGLLTDPDSPSVSQTSPASTQPMDTNEVPKSTPKARSDPSRGTPVQTQASRSSQKGMIINGVFVPNYQRRHSISSAQEVSLRSPSLIFIPKSAATYYLRRERRRNPPRLFHFLMSLQSQKPEEDPQIPQTPKTPLKRHWHDQRYDFDAPTTPTSILRRSREPTQTLQTTEDTSLAALSPRSSPRLPTPPRPATKRKRDGSSGAQDLSSLPQRPVKRSRGYQAPDPFGSTSSPSSTVPSSASLGPSVPPFEANADHSCLDLVTTEGSDVDSDDPSPLSRARNKAELFKPKTPSRLRESTRIPSSNMSTPSAIGLSSPSFLGASLNSSPYRSDPMSIDGSSYLLDVETPPIDAPVTTTEARLSDARPNIAVNSMAQDVAWLLETLPNGNFADLQWPARRSLVEVLGMKPEAQAIADKCWEENGSEAVRYFEALFNS
ncbi:hypothetical protein F1880_000246 [Penicillium rolfsii]|nr:hypothetical protein F1880_000246 [Penicillium rolfsii]